MLISRAPKLSSKPLVSSSRNEFLWHSWTTRKNAEKLLASTVGRISASTPKSSITGLMELPLLHAVSPGAVLGRCWRRRVSQGRGCMRGGLISGDLLTVGNSEIH
eukprot:3957241-Prymnesium_polylepis.1